MVIVVFDADDDDDLNVTGTDDDFEFDVVILSHYYDCALSKSLWLLFIHR
jgi:hypothetical protein